MIGETVGEPYAAVALVHAVLDHNWEEAEQEFRRALEFEPSSGFARHWYALFFPAPALRLGEATEEMRRALEMDPFSPFHNVFLGPLPCWQRRYEQAIQQLRNTLELDPYHYRTYALLGMIHMAAGSFDQAVALLEESVQFGGRNWNPAGQEPRAGEYQRSAARSAAGSLGKRGHATQGNARVRLPIRCRCSVAHSQTA